MDEIELCSAQENSAKSADTYAQEDAHFKPLHEQLNNGGLEAMLFDLLDRGLGELASAPNRAHRRARRATGYKPVVVRCVVVDLFHDGYLPAGDSAGQVISGEYRMRKSEGYYTGDSKRTWFEKRKRLLELVHTSSPALKKETDAAFGRQLRKRKCVCAKVCRQRGWQFPPLDQCRAEWKKRFPDTVWEEPYVTSWQGERDDDCGD